MNARMIRNVRPERMSHARPHRRGLGVFVLLASITLATLLIATMMRLDWSSRALDEAAGGVGGAVAEQLALSAVAEAMWRLQTEGNTPGEAVFEDVRSKLRTTRGPIDLSEALAPVLLKKSLGKNEDRFGIATFEKFEAILRPAGAERQLKVSCTVRVDHGGGGFARRTATETRGWGLNAIFAPQPLDQLTAGILRVDSLSEHVPALGRWLDAIVEYNRALRDYAIFVEQLKELPDGIGKRRFDIMPAYFSFAAFAGFSGNEAAVLASQRAAEPWRDRELKLELMRQGTKGTLEKAGRGYQARLSEDVYFARKTPLIFDVDREENLKTTLSLRPGRTSLVVQEAENAMNALLSFSDEVDLEKWDPNARFKTMLDRSANEIAKIGNQITRLNRQTDATTAERSKSPDGGAREYMREMNRLFKELELAIQTGTDAINEFTRAMLGETHAPLSAPPGAGSPNPAITAKLGVKDVPEWFKQFHGANGGLSVRWSGPEIAAWKKEHKDEALPPAELEIDKWEGKSFIEMHVEDTLVKKLVVQDAARDLVVLRSAATRLEGGRLDAGVYAGTITQKESVEIHGALVIAHHPTSAVDPADATKVVPLYLKGTVIHDKRLQAGVFVNAGATHGKPDWRRVCDESYVLILDPQAWARDVQQSRGSR